ncbi:MAG: PD40 domain-containing protein [Anaerolineae bacterium]|nr:PD40 domain-containing protein [Anaerolineae bacterium]
MMIVRALGLITLLLVVFPALSTDAAAPEVCLRVETVISRPADDVEPVWSPDGSRIAFVGHDEGNPEVYVYDPATSPRIVNISHDPLDDYAPLWSPDGRYLVYLHRQVRYAWQPVQPIIVDLTSGNHQPVTTEFLSVRDMQWTPDSQALLYADQNGYHRYDLARRENVTLSTVANPVTSYFTVSASQNRQRAVIIPWNELPRVIDTTSGATLVTSDESFNRASLSPDGSQLVYIEGNPPAQSFLYAADIASGQHSQLASADERGIAQLTWSPDGRLAWTEVGWDRDANSPITTLRLSSDLTSAGRELLTIHHDIRQLAWSPTRDQLAFITYAGVYVIDIPSGVFHEFIQGYGYITKIAWSADGDYLAAQISVVADYAPYSAVAITDIAHGDVSLLEGNFLMHGWSPSANKLLVTGSGRETDVMLLTPCAP